MKPINQRLLHETKTKEALALRFSVSLNLVGPDRMDFVQIFTVLKR